MSNLFKYQAIQYAESIQENILNQGRPSEYNLACSYNILLIVIPGILKQLMNSQDAPAVLKYAYVLNEALNYIENSEDLVLLEIIQSYRSLLSSYAKNETQQPTNDKLKQSA